MYITDANGIRQRDSQDKLFTVKNLKEAEEFLSFYWDMGYGDEFRVVMDDGSERTYRHCAECCESWCVEDGQTHECPYEGMSAEESAWTAVYHRQLDEEIMQKAYLEDTEWLVSGSEAE